MWALMARKSTFSISTGVFPIRVTTTYKGLLRPVVSKRWHFSNLRSLRAGKTVGSVIHLVVMNPGPLHEPTGLEREMNRFLLIKRSFRKVELAWLITFIPKRSPHFCWQTAATRSCHQGPQGSQVSATRRSRALLHALAHPDSCTSGPKSWSSHGRSGRRCSPCPASYYSGATRFI
jgi:hypothetical protein